MRINDRVITERMLADQLQGQTRLEVRPDAKLTPMALDYVRDHSVELVRAEESAAGASNAPRSHVPTTSPVRAPNTEGRKRFRGIFCPNIVIFDADGKINHAEMEHYVDWLIVSGIHGLYPNGSTGEFVRLSWEERQDVVRLMCEVNNGRVPVLAGANEGNVRDVLRMAEFYAGIGVDAISIVPPYYYKISDKSLFEYYADVARRSPLDILLYNIPQFTQEISIDIMEELLEFETIFGTKDSSRDMPRLENTIHRMRRHRPDYVVLVGCEELLFPAVLMGASGGTIATSGVIPEVITDIYDRTIAGDIEGACELQYRILDLIGLMLLRTNFPEGFKTGVAVRGFDVGPSRQIMSEEERQYLLTLESQISCILSDMGYPIDGARACPATNLPPIVRSR
jgi:4-hydroxy-tetrahydrodipicolinate synthase